MLNFGISYYVIEVGENKNNNKIYGRNKIFILEKRKRKIGKYDIK